MSGENFLYGFKPPPAGDGPDLRPDGMRGRYLAAPLPGGRAPMGRRPCAGKGNCELVDVEA
jgi:hypothetical protein